VLQAPELGVLEDVLHANRAEIVSRVKILSRLDISEKRRPQDGRFRVLLEKDGQVINVDFRVSIIPGYHGENVVLRMLDPRAAPRSIEALGFSDAITTRLAGLLRATTGMILVTGPTGSGKSTTLFATLRTLYRPGIKILTAENPIEYVDDRFSQHEVNERLGNTFARYLRAFLRHDPEVIMVGEIRDAETAELAVRAAQTGHLVLSTMHTNDAVSAVTRLWDLGVDSSLITSSLLGVLSQRLVRRLCTHCAEQYTPPAELLHALFDRPAAGLSWVRGRGCTHCSLTGYTGRVAVGELWTPGDEDAMLINMRAPFDQIRRSAARTTLPMAADVMDRLVRRETTVEEIVRTLPYTSLRQLREPQP
jgi:type IV pilus assembly protein PilB